MISTWWGNAIHASTGKARVFTDVVLRRTVRLARCSQGFDVHTDVDGRREGNVQCLQKNCIKFCSEQLTSDPSQVVAQPGDRFWPEVASQCAKAQSCHQTGQPLFWLLKSTELHNQRMKTHSQTFANRRDVSAKERCSFGVRLYPHYIECFSQGCGQNWSQYYSLAIEALQNCLHVC